jgi:hypothetical protein
VEKIERDRETERWRWSSSGLRWRRMKLYRTRGRRLSTWSSLARCRPLQRGEEEDDASPLMDGPRLLATHRTGKWTSFWWAVKLGCVGGLRSIGWLLHFFLIFFFSFSVFKF